MSRERLFRHDEELGEFDWRAAARELDVDLETAQELVEYALHTALGNRQRAERVYLQQLQTYAHTQKPEQPLAAPGRNVEPKYEAGAGKQFTQKELARLPVGKYTQVQVATARAERFPGYNDWAASMEASLAAVQAVSKAVGSSPISIEESAQTSVEPAAGAGDAARPPRADEPAGAAPGQTGPAPSAWSGRASNGSHLASTRPHLFARKPRTPDPAAPAVRQRIAAPAVRVPAAPVTATAPAVPVVASPAASPAASPGVTLRQQLAAAAVMGQGTADPLAAADPETAREVLHHLHTDDASTLRLVTQAAGGTVERVLGHGSASEALPAEHAARLGPHIGAEAAGAARLHTDEAADLVAAAHHAHAVTVGSDVYFARGAYAPGTGPRTCLALGNRYISRGAERCYSRHATRCSSLSA